MQSNLSLIIRLHKATTLAKNGSYWIVVATTQMRIKGGYIEKLGIVSPNGEYTDVNMDLGKIRYWLFKGADMSEKVRWYVAYMRSFQKTKE